MSVCTHAQTSSSAPATAENIYVCLFWNYHQITYFGNYVFTYFASSFLLLSEISGSYGGEYEDDSLNETTQLYIPEDYHFPFYCFFESGEQSRGHMVTGQENIFIAVM
jgi:hypothetical protein